MGIVYSISPRCLWCFLSFIPKAEEGTRALLWFISSCLLTETTRVHLHKATSRNELGFPLTPCQALLNFRLTMSAHKIELNVKELTRREGGVAPAQQTPVCPRFAVSLLRHSQIKEHQIPAWFDFITAGNDDDFLQSPTQLCEEKICLTVKPDLLPQNFFQFMTPP